MSTKERNKQLYVEARHLTECSQNDWARLFNLQSYTGVKHRQSGQPNVSYKEKGVKGVNNAEALASGLLVYFHKLGFDVKNIEFDDAGGIVHIPKLRG